MAKTPSKKSASVTKETQMKNKSESNGVSKSTNNNVSVWREFKYSLLCIFAVTVGVSIVCVQFVKPHVNNYYSSDSKDLTDAVKVLQEKLHALEENIQNTWNPGMEKVREEIIDTEVKFVKQSAKYDDLMLNIRSEVTESAIKLNHYSQIIKELEEENKELKSHINDVKVTSRRGSDSKQSSDTTKELKGMRSRLDALNSSYSLLTKTMKSDKSVIKSKLKKITEDVEENQQIVHHLDDSLESMTTAIISKMKKTSETNADFNQTSLQHSQEIDILKKLINENKSNETETRKFYTELAHNVTNQINSLVDRLDECESRQRQLVENDADDNDYVKLSDRLTEVESHVNWMNMNYHSMLHHTSKLDDDFKHLSRHVNQSDMTLGDLVRLLENTTTSTLISLESITKDLEHFKQSMALQTQHLIEVGNLTTANKLRINRTIQQFRTNAINTTSKITFIAKRLQVFEANQKRLVKNVRNGYVAIVHSINALQNQTDQIGTSHQVLTNQTIGVKEELREFKNNMTDRILSTERDDTPTLTNHSLDSTLKLMKMYVNFIANVLKRKLHRVHLEVMLNSRNLVSSEEIMQDLNESVISPVKQLVRHQRSGHTKVLSLIRNLQNALSSSNLKESRLQNAHYKELSNNTMQAISQLRQSLLSLSQQFKRPNISMSEMVTMETDQLKRYVDFRAAVIYGQLGAIDGRIEELRKPDINVSMATDSSILESKLRNIEKQLKVLSRRLHKRKTHGNKKNQKKLEKKQLKADSIQNEENCDIHANSTDFEHDEIIWQTVPDKNVIESGRSHAGNDDVTKLDVEQVTEQSSHTDNDDVTQLSVERVTELKQIFNYVEFRNSLLSAQLKIQNRDLLRHFDASFNNMQNYLEFRFGAQGQRLSFIMEEIEDVQKYADDAQQQVLQNVKQFIAFSDGVTSQYTRSLAEKLDEQGKELGAMVQGSLQLSNGLQSGQLEVAFLQNRISELERQQSSTQELVSQLNAFLNFMNFKQQAEQRLLRTDLQDVEEKQKELEMAGEREHDAFLATVSDFQNSLQEQGKKTANIITKLRTVVQNVQTNMEDEVTSLYNTTSTLLKNMRKNNVEQERRLNLLQNKCHSDRKILDNLVRKTSSAGKEKVRKKSKSKKTASTDHISTDDAVKMYENVDLKQPEIITVSP
ncbi:uncharacterized protein LOC144444558 [Glandiceps talaboti]